MSFTALTVSRYGAAEQQYGVTFVPNLGTAYPELKELTGDIYAKRVAKLPWVPASWLAGVQALQSQYPADVIRFLPSRMASGQPNPNNPLFLDSDDKIDVWMSINDNIQDGVVKYANAQAAAGRAELNALYARAAYWDAAYKIVNFVAELPSNVASGFGGLVKDFILGDLRKNYGRTLLLLALGLVLLLFLVKPDLAKAWFGGLFSWLGRVTKGAAKGATAKAAT